MSILSEDSYNRSTQKTNNLLCTDTLYSPLKDTKMHPKPWKSFDKDYKTLILTQTSPPNPFYLHSKQPNLTSTMRAILIDWLFEISSEFYLKRQTCHNAILLIDRFLSNSAPIKREKFQLLGLAACILACKLEEVSYPKLTDFIKSAGNIYTVRDIREMEREVLKALKWKIVSPNVYGVADWLCCQWDGFIVYCFAKKLPELMLRELKGYKRYRDVMQIIDISIMDIEVLKFDIKIVAACAVYLVLFNCFQVGFPDCPEFYSSASPISIFIDLFLTFLNGTLKISSIDTLFDCGTYMNQYMSVPKAYDFPKACKSGVRPETGFAEFLAYQTHSPLNIQAIKAQRA